MVVAFELRSLFLLLLYKAVVGIQVEENKGRRKWKASIPQQEKLPEGGEGAHKPAYSLSFAS